MPKCAAVRGDGCRGAWRLPALGPSLSLWALYLMLCIMYAAAKLRGPGRLPFFLQPLTRFSHHLPVEARDRPVITSLRLPAVLTVLFKYTSARQAARASY